MVKRRVSRVAPLLGRKSDHSFSKEELHIIPQLLQLLRSGALSSLLAANQVSSSVDSTSQSNNLKSEKSKPALESPANFARGCGWTPERQIASKWVVGPDQKVSRGDEFDNARHLLGINSGRKEIGERIEKRQTHRNSSPRHHH